MSVSQPLRIKKSERKDVVYGVAHITSTFNNTIVTITDTRGDVISSSSAGCVGFKGSKKSSPYAGQMTAEGAGRVAQAHGVKQLAIQTRGPGLGKDSAVRSLMSLGFTITTITDVTTIPHNGCRPPKQRRN